MAGSSRHPLCMYMHLVQHMLHIAPRCIRSTDTTMHMCKHTCTLRHERNHIYPVYLSVAYTLAYRHTKSLQRHNIACCMGTRIIPLAAYTHVYTRHAIHIHRLMHPYAYTQKRQSYKTQLQCIYIYTHILMHALLCGVCSVICIHIHVCALVECVYPRQQQELNEVIFCKH
jgi:hypothetical protein